MNNITYTRHGDYFLPDLCLPEEDGRNIDIYGRNIDIYGRRHLAYLKQHHRITYINLLTSGKLHTYLADINEQTTDRLALLMRQLAQDQGITARKRGHNRRF